VLAFTIQLMTNAQGGFSIGEVVRIQGTTSVTLSYNGLRGTIHGLHNGGVTVELERGPRELTGFNPPGVFGGPPVPLVVKEIKTFQYNEIEKIDSTPSPNC